MAIDRSSPNAELQWSPFVPPDEKKTSAITKAAIAALTIFVSTLIVATVCVAIFNPVALASTAIIVTSCFVSVAAGCVLGYAFKSLKNYLEDDGTPLFDRASFANAEEHFELESNAGTLEEVAKASQGLTNPGSNCFMNALLQNIFTSQCIGKFVMESLQHIAFDDKFADVNPFDHLDPIISIPKPKGMSDKDYAQFKARLLTNKETIIEKHKFKLELPASLNIDDVLESCFSSVDKMEKLYTAITFKQAASYAFTILTKWQARETISSQEAILLRISLVKLINAEVRCEIEEVRAKTKNPSAKAMMKKAQEEVLGYKIARKKLQVKYPFNPRLRYLVPISKAIAHFNSKAKTHHLGPKVALKTFKTTSQPVVKWDLPGINSGLKIHHDVQECPGELFNTLLSSLEELTGKKAPSTIRIQRTENVFRLPTEGTDETYFDESLRIHAATKVIDEDNILSIKGPEGDGATVNLSDLSDVFENIFSRDEEQNKDFYNKDMPELKTQHPVVSTKRTYQVQLPESLMMQCKLSHMNHGNEGKKIKNVKFAFSDEDSLKITIKANALIPEDKTYQLRSFVCHKGFGSQSGHYINYTKVDREDGSSYWIKHDDSTCSPASLAEVKALLNGRSSYTSPCVFNFKSVT